MGTVKVGEAGGRRIGGRRWRRVRRRRRGIGGGGGRAIELGFVRTRVEAELLAAEILKADQCVEGHFGGAEQVGVVQVGKDMKRGEIALQLAKDWMEGGGEEPGAVGVALTNPLAGTDEASGLLSAVWPAARRRGNGDRLALGVQGGGVGVLALRRRKEAGEGGDFGDGLHDLRARDGIEAVT